MDSESEDGKFSMAWDDFRDESVFTSLKSLPTSLFRPPTNSEIPDSSFRATPLNIPSMPIDVLRFISIGEDSEQEEEEANLTIDSPKKSMFSVSMNSESDANFNFLRTELPKLIMENNLLKAQRDYPMVLCTGPCLNIPGGKVELPKSKPSSGRSFIMAILTTSLIAPLFGTCLGTTSSILFHLLSTVRHGYRLEILFIMSICFHFGNDTNLPIENLIAKYIGICYSCFCALTNYILFVHFIR